MGFEGNVSGGNHATPNHVWLPNPEEKGNAITKDSFQKMGYMERVKLANENPEAYKALTEN